MGWGRGRRVLQDRRNCRVGGDCGSAVVEYVAVVVGLLVPLTVGVVALAQLESAVVGVHAAAQLASRAYLAARSDSVGRFAAVRSAAIAGRNHGLLIDDSAVLITCAVADCHTRGTVVTVAVEVPVHVGAGSLVRSVPVRAARTVVIGGLA